MPKDKRKAKERRDKKESSEKHVGAARSKNIRLNPDFIEEVSTYSFSEDGVEIETELAETTEDRLTPRPYVGTQIVYRKTCRNCKAEFGGWAESETIWVGCPACGADMPLEPSDYMRNINVWSLTPKGERLGPVEE